MAYTTFNQNKFDHKKEPMFFGQPVSVARYDDPKFPFFERQTRRIVSFFWVPEEISLEKDRRDFMKLKEHEKHIFLSNLKYQTLLDSVQGRSPNAVLLPIVSLPELETSIETWSFSETVHSRSYTHIIRNLVNTPSEIFESIVGTPEIMERATSVTKYYDDLWESIIQLESIPEDDPQRHFVVKEAKLRLFKCMVAINVLEAVRFYVSFACSFAFAEQGIMEGNAKIIKLIARDEATHLAITQNIIKVWLDGRDDPEMTKIANENKDFIVECFKDAAIQEKEWADYLFKDGAMLGLNSDILKQFVDFKVNERLAVFGIDPVTEVVDNPLPWMRQWITSDQTNVAPQETELSSYLVGAIDDNIDVEKIETL